MWQWRSLKRIVEAVYHESSRKQKGKEAFFINCKEIIKPQSSRKTPVPEMWPKNQLETYKQLWDATWKTSDHLTISLKNAVLLVQKHHRGKSKYVKNGECHSEKRLINVERYSMARPKRRENIIQFKSEFWYKMKQRKKNSFAKLMLPEKSGRRKNNQTDSAAAVSTWPRISWGIKRKECAVGPGLAWLLS